MSFDTTDIALSVIKIAIVLGVLLNVTPIMVWNIRNTRKQR